MAGFGDNSTTFMRTGGIPTGGLRIEAGCYTSGTADATAYIPTQLSEVVAFVCGSASPNESADISGGFLRCSLGTNSAGEMNYIAVGW